MSILKSNIRLLLVEAREFGSRYNQQQLRVMLHNIDFIKFRVFQNLREGPTFVLKIAPMAVLAIPIGEVPFTIFGLESRVVLRIH
jgi:hypothetical protein